MTTRTILIAAAAALLSWTVASAEPAPSPPLATLPSGQYTLDPSHASLVFHVNHLGVSNFTSRFSKFDATLDIDPAHPKTARVTATIDPASVELVGSDLASILKSDKWFNVARFPQMTFKSTKVERTGDKTARITGDLTLHGITRPVVLGATFNGGYGKNSFDPGGARIGFSARGTLNRSQFGLAEGIPAPGTTMGVGDAVQFQLEVEFSKKD
jgi:polyisoprenoid-binding protein YceI